MDRPQATHASYCAMNYSGPDDQLSCDCPAALGAGVPRRPLEEDAQAVVAAARAAGLYKDRPRLCSCGDYTPGENPRGRCTRPGCEADQDADIIAQARASIAREEKALARPPDTKPTNPKDAVGVAKPPASTVPATVTAELGVAMMEGARKYARHNYRKVGVRASIYYDATRRHLDYWWEGQDIDPDSGLSHVTKAIASLTVLRDSMIRGNWVDDRPPKTDPAFWEDLARRAKAVIEKYPEPKAPITETGES